MSETQVTAAEVKDSLEREMKPLVLAFAKKLERESGLREDILVGPPCPGESA